MQKWEYLLVDFHTHNYSLNGGEPINYERPTAGQSNTKPQMVDTLNKLGREGWELIESTPYYCFKRRISN
ncbi:MAG: hypothetical protein QOK48_726 [Blastocatellia bacterium]|jgi:hypothetical protein|nr:hypothetical protein [Blastocatellia bacterium]